MLKAFTHIFPGARAVHRRVRPGRARRRGGRRARRRPDDALEGNASDDALEGNAGDLRGLLWVGTAARHEEREVHVRQGGTLTLALISFHFPFLI